MQAEEDSELPTREALVRRLDSRSSSNINQALEVHPLDSHSRVLEALGSRNNNRH